MSILVDIYSLGSLLYTMLAGRPAFAPRPDEGLVALYLRIARQPVPDLRATGVPTALADLVEPAMAKDRDARPPTAAAFGRELQAIQRDLGAPITDLPIVDDRVPPERFSVIAGGRTESLVETNVVTAAEASTTAGPSTAAEPIAPNQTGMATAAAGSSPRENRRRVALVGGLLAVAMAWIAWAVSALRTEHRPSFRCVADKTRCAANNADRLGLTVKVQSTNPVKADGKDEAAVAIRLANIGKVAITTSNVRVLITAPAGTAFAPYSAPTDYGTDWTCRSDAPPAGLSVRCVLTPPKGAMPMTLDPGTDTGLQVSVTADTPGRHTVRVQLSEADFRPDPISLEPVTETFSAAP